MGTLTLVQYTDFINILLKVYPMRPQFALMLTTRLGKGLDAIATTGTLETDIFYVIQAAEAQGWTLQLINAIRESRPDNPQIIEFSQQFKLASIDKNRKELERIIKDGNGFLDAATLLSELGEAEMRVCRIELPLNTGNMGYGTGFLVGQSTVITNYHVIEPILNNKVKAEDVILRFDYKRLKNGPTLNQGTPYELVDGEDWCIISSPFSQADIKEVDEYNLPNENELDFALLRVKGKPANDRVSKVMEPEAPRRGYFEIPDPAIEVTPGEPLFILQHPEGDYLKLAIDQEGSLDVNANRTRLRYTTNSLRGSSGSPCFNVNWKLVALHHAGDPNYSKLHKPQYNQGIPIGLIRSFVDKQGKLNEMVA